MSKIPKFVLLVYLLGCFHPVKAQLLTIQDAVDQAIKNNAPINQMRSQLNQKKEEWRTQTGISAPEFSYMKEGINNKAADPFQEKRMTVSQSIDFPLTTAYRLKGIRQEEKAMEFSIQEEERKVKANVKSRYVEVIYALHLQKLRDQQLKLATELYNAVYTQFETGMGNGMDLTKAELQVAESNNDIDDARRQLHQARYSLFNLMGLPPENQKYTIEFMDSLKSNDVAISQITALSVLTEQPSYQSSIKELEASGYFLKEARSNILPDIRFNLYKQDYGTGYNFNGFELGLSFPIWYPLEQKGKIRMNLARQEEIQWKQKEIRSGVKEQIEHAWHSYEVSRSTIKRYDETIRSKAEKLQALTLSAYKLGEVDLLNLIQAQQIYLNSQQRYLSALREFYIQLIELEKFLNKELVY
ncbi:heavy metal RND efflux outer membrane protein, CzcC family [Aquipluma nitroreducens]|uniref:Heavy metal RND efflux outer membrane protein, CzcC family n=1 Tax=Aquipluma nitroreducens TaxID=2010828 RepID=A0A5K7SA62_9BACT|nr:TolC family protein [Aquipluma nitroreducens]BBE18356.1 heavy metal RND efflux outer membrane protein, CzcC family [Aquipluma nitroreducens]